MSKHIRANRIAAGAALAALALAGAQQAIADGDGDPLAIPPPTRYALPGVTLHVTPSQVNAGAGAQFTFRAVQTRRTMKRGVLTLTLPKLWRERPSAGAPTYAVVPLTGAGSSSRVRVRRSGRVLRFSFTNGRRNDSGRFTVSDRALPGGTYRAPFALRVGGFQAGTGSLSVVVLPAPALVPAP
jgi:hypothetical protein